MAIELIALVAKRAEKAKLKVTLGCWPKYPTTSVSNLLEDLNRESVDQALVWQSSSVFGTL